MSQIEIKIVGGQGIGKSILAKSIFDFLSAEGHSVAFKDEKITLFSKSAIRNKNSGQIVPIRIETKQVA